MRIAQRPFTAMLQTCNLRALESPRSPTQIAVIDGFRRSPEQGPSPAYAGHCGSLIPLSGLPQRLSKSRRGLPLRHGGIFLRRFCWLQVCKVSG